MSEDRVGRVDDHNITNYKPKLEQATRPRARGAKRGLFANLRKWALAGTVAAGAVGAGVVVINEYDKGAFSRETLTQAQANGKIDGIDTAQYLVRVHLDGQNSELRFRKGISNKTENIDLSHVVKINGMPWNGSSPFTIENTPYAMGISPANGILEESWLMLQLQVRTLLGDIVNTVGYVNSGDAVGEHVSRIAEGRIARASTDNRRSLIGVLDSGKQIPADRIGLTQPYNPTPNNPS